MKILIGGAGGAPSEGVIQSLLACPKGDEVIGIGSEPTDLVLSKAKSKYLVPYANAPGYRESLLKILRKERPHLVHFQNDLEVFEASKLRAEIHELGVKTYMPSHEVVDICVHKFKTYQVLRRAGIKVPENMQIRSKKELRAAFKTLGDGQGRIWIRASSIGGGGKGSLPTNDCEFACGWLNRHSGWGDFVAAEMLTAETVTWMSIWFEGSLVVAQSRIRRGWTHGNRSVSGVTGVTKVGLTVASAEVDAIATATILAVDPRPHGLYGVDMTYDGAGVPNPTEINISRFFTTILFFTHAGLNMPKIFKDIALHNEFPLLKKKINPLPDGLMWLRGMDTLPLLMTENEFRSQIIFPE